MNAQTVGYSSLREVKINEKWGYINEHAKLVIEPSYYRAHPFSEELAVVQLDRREEKKRSLFAVINGIGEIVIPPFSDVPHHKFSNGLLHVADYQKEEYGNYFLDKRGNRFCEGKFQSIGHFRNERACVRINSQFGFINPDGDLIIAPRFKEWSLFYDGYAVVSEQNNKTGIINIDGEYVLEPSKEPKYLLSEGAAISRTANGFQFIDLNGNPLFGDLFFKHGPGMFADGMAPYLLEDDGLIGYIDRKGNMFKPMYHSGGFSDFSEGLCAVDFPDGRKAYINKRCEEVIDISNCTMAGKFKDGWAAVWIGEKLGYISRLGEYVWEPRG